MYSNSPSGTYSWGTLGTPSLTSANTTYSWTPISALTGASVLMVAGGGGTGLDQYGGGGGAKDVNLLEVGNRQGPLNHAFQYRSAIKYY